jgi:pimeloyl-ACP methyl ester carboxylesterase
MHIIERGHGAPLVLIPGIQGRWEYLRPAVEALAPFFRVITFPLCGEPSSRLAIDPARGLDNYVAQVVSVLGAKQIERAVICGVSFGGLVALRFAAAHPDRTAALVLASTPAPLFRLRTRHAIYCRVPWILGPLFLAETPWRVRRETAAALPSSGARRAFARAAMRTLIEAPVSVSRMAARARLLSNIDLRADCGCVTAATLVVTGEHRLDFVVPVEGSSEYARLIPNARAAVLERTGHLGTITRPDAFAELVRTFVDQVRRKPDTTDVTIEEVRLKPDTAETAGDHREPRSRNSGSVRLLLDDARGRQPDRVA